MADKTIVFNESHSIHKSQ